MSIEITKTVVTTEKGRLELTGEHILNLLHHSSLIETAIPYNAKVRFSVPGGGDWSNTDMDIDEETPIHITWETTTREEK